MHEQTLTQHLPDDVVLSVRNVSKKFCSNLKRSMLYGMLDLGRGLAGQKLDCSRLREGEFWAVDDVSFDLKKGETLGIIGENGSGKSTLLRVLTGIFPPDRGEVMFRGRVGGLIALGAGMHPHMTGLENIYLNGSILGLSRREISRQIDEIVEFAEIGDFIHAPLSTYSSGMKVRLGFAVAIHCTPDILLLDEVLAVGDLAFQRKCFSRIENLRGTKVTTIFISHNLRQVERMCDRALLLQSGRVIASGVTAEVVDNYFKMQMEKEERTALRAHADGPEVQSVGGLHLLRVEVLGEGDVPIEEVPTGTDFALRLRFRLDHALRRPYWAVGLLTSDMMLVGAVSNEFDSSRVDCVGDVVAVCRFRRCPLLPGVYSVRLKVRDTTSALLLAADRVATFRVVNGANMRFGLDRAGLVYLDAEWAIRESGRGPEKDARKTC